MPKVCVIAPGRVDGGANLLLGRAAMRLAKKYGWTLHLVDVEGGAVWRLWSRAGVAFSFQVYNPGKVLSVEPTDCVLVCLLGAKLIGTNWLVRREVRLLLWCTAPQDSFKFLPWSIIANRWSWQARSFAAFCLSWGHKRRIGRFLREASRRGGLVFMDEHTFEVSSTIFGHGIVKHIIPICTDEPDRPRRPSFCGMRRAYWIGRVSDFKTESLIAGASALLGANSEESVEEVVVIGAGEGMEHAKVMLAGMPVRWLGALTAEAMDEEIYTHAWLVFGHATSLLEAAKFGIPSLLIDATYEPVNLAEVRMEWVHRVGAAYVGAIVPGGRLTGRNPRDCLNELTRAPAAIGVGCQGRWLREHSPAIVAELLSEALKRSSYTVGDLLDSGATRPGVAGQLTEWAKRVIFRRIN